MEGSKDWSLSSPVAIVSKKIALSKPQQGFFYHRREL
jgi:hypothetical protein